MNMEKQKRVHFINSLGGFKSVSLLGTVNKQGQTNLAIFSSVFHIKANPSLIALIFRPSPPERNIFRNIIDTEFYTINHLNENIYKQAHQTSARYDSDISEFDVTGLQPEFKNNFKAPLLQKAAFNLEWNLRNKLTLRSTIPL